MKEQQLYSELLPDGRASHPISKGKPSHPTEETHFSRDLVLMTIGEGRNQDRPVHRELRLSSQLSLHHNGTDFRCLKKRILPTLQWNLVHPCLTIVFFMHLCTVYRNAQSPHEHCYQPSHWAPVQCVPQYQNAKLQTNYSIHTGISSILLRSRLCSVANQFCLLWHSLALKGCHYGEKKNRCRHWTEDLFQAPLCSLQHQLRLYHCLSTTCFRKEIKKGHCFSNPPGLKAFTTLQPGASAGLPIGTEWNHIRGMQAALSPIMWLVALNI